MEFISIACNFETHTNVTDLCNHFCRWSLLHIINLNLYCYSFPVWHTIFHSVYRIDPFGLLYTEHKWKLNLNFSQFRTQKCIICIIYSFICFCMRLDSVRLTESASLAYIHRFLQLDWIYSLFLCAQLFSLSLSKYSI